MNGYQTSIEIDCPGAKVFYAISRDINAWWGKQDQAINEVGITFTVSWGVPWYKFEVEEFIPNEGMIWKCIDANQVIEGLDNVQKEWVGTRVIWRLEQIAPSKTLLRFTHEGIVPEFICFDFCTKTWEHFLHRSLIEYCTR